MKYILEIIFVSFTILFGYLLIKNIATFYSNPWSFKNVVIYYAKNVIYALPTLVFLLASYFNWRGN